MHRNKSHHKKGHPPPAETSAHRRGDVLQHCKSLSYGREGIGEVMPVTLE